MEVILRNIPVILIIAGIWNLANGLLHDIFVLRSPHARQYDRTLLRLLMDGHILMTCGTILLLSSNGVRSGYNYAFYISITTLASIIIYCFMIFPFLKSIGTLFINFTSLVILIISFIKK